MSRFSHARSRPLSSFCAREHLFAAVALDHHERHLFDAFVGRVAPLAGQALAPAADGVAGLGVARIDDFALFAAAERTTHRNTTSPQDVVPPVSADTTIVYSRAAATILPAAFRAIRACKTLNLYVEGEGTSPDGTRLDAAARDRCAERSGRSAAESADGAAAAQPPGGDILGAVNVIVLPTYNERENLRHALGPHPRGRGRPRRAAAHADRRRQLARRHRRARRRAGARGARRLGAAPRRQGGPRQGVHRRLPRGPRPWAPSASSRWTPTSATTPATCRTSCASSTRAPTSCSARATSRAAASRTGACRARSSAAAAASTRRPSSACRCTTSPAASSASAARCSRPSTSTPSTPRATASRSR